MKPHHLLALMAAMAALASACAHRPSGFTKAEWDALPPAKQAEYEKLARIEDNRKQREADADRRAADQAVKDAEKHSSTSAADASVPR